jgi:hypothetical protein
MLLNSEISLLNFHKQSKETFLTYVKGYSSRIEFSDLFLNSFLALLFIIFWRSISLASMQGSYSNGTLHYSISEGNNFDQVSSRFNYSSASIKSPSVSYLFYCIEGIINEIEEESKDFREIQTKKCFLDKEFSNLVNFENLYAQTFKFRVSYFTILSYCLRPRYLLYLVLRF